MAIKPIYIEGKGAYPDCYENKLRKAKKAWKCLECGGTIYPGVYYEYFRYCKDKKFKTVQVCFDCRSVLHHLVSGQWVLGRLWSDIMLNILEHTIPEIPEDILNRLTMGARRMINRRLFLIKYFT